MVKKLGHGGEFVQADLFSLEDVKRLAGELKRKAPKLDLLINNAGGAFNAPEPTVDGLERTFALNVVAPFVLTEALVAPLAAAKGRVVNVVTGITNAMKASVDQLVGPNAKGGMMSYVRNKLALIAVTNEQQKASCARRPS